MRILKFYSNLQIDNFFNEGNKKYSILLVIKVSSTSNAISMQLYRIELKISTLAYCMSFVVE
jgi:hypothetical protein